MASGIYDSGFEDMLDGNLDWVVDDIRLMLLKTSYTFAVTHAVVGNISADEVAGTGYSRKVLGTKTINFNAGAREFRYDAADVVWTQIQNDLSESTKAAVIFRQITNDADSVLIAYIEDGSTLTFNDGQVTLAFDSTGAFKVGV